MTYCTVQEVKDVLQMTETTWDFEVEALLPTADALVDAMLLVYSLTVDSSVPELCKARVLRIERRRSRIVRLTISSFL